MSNLKFFRKQVFPVLAGTLWLIFLFLDLTRLSDTTWIKFAAICLCCVTALLGAGTADGKLVAAALCFTVAADWLLLVQDDHYSIGLLFFLIVQFCYLYRLGRLQASLLPLSSRQEKLLHTLQTIRWSLPFPLALLILFLRPAQYDLLFLVLFYFSALVLNTIAAFALKKRVFAWGLLLFVCCDLCVGAWNLGLLPGFTRIGMWLFYLPSQVLIVLSQEQEKGYPHEKAV